MTLLGFIDHRLQVVLTIVLIIFFFMFLGRIDFVYIPRDTMASPTVDLGFVTIHEGWFWMWIVGFPLLALGVAATYVFGASDTERNMWYGFGLGATVILFAVGQLEDFFYHFVNPEVSWIPASQDWAYNGWSAENNLCWRLFGTWNTDMHLIWLSCFIAIVVCMWIAIFRRC